MGKNIKLTVLMCLLTLSATAQEISLRDLRQAPQFIASSDQVRDWDDEPCALVKIQGANIDSISGAFEVVKRSGETWAYMTKGDKKLTIFKEGYQPLPVLFDDYGIEGLQSNRVYIIAIFAPELKPKKWFIGIHGGANFSTASLKTGYGDSPKMVTNFNVGGTATYKFSDFIGVTAGLFYSAKGYDLEATELFSDEKCNGNFLDVPIMANLFYDVSPSVTLQAMAGPYFAYNLGGKVTASGKNNKKENLGTMMDEEFKDYYSSIDYGIQGGIGITFAKHYSINATYQYGFGIDKYTNQTICLNLGYIF